jgi:predicted transcriptional regulator
MTFRLSPEERKRIEELAEACGKKPSIFVRDRALARLRIPTQQSLLRQLAGVATNLNQLTRYANTHRVSPPETVLLPLLDEVRALIIHLARGTQEEDVVEL